MAEDDKALLAKLRRDISSHSPLSVEKVVATRFDTLAILAFLEFMYPIRIAVFILGQELLSPACNIFLFGEIWEKEGEPKMNPIVLVILVATAECLDKIVLNLGLGT